MATGRFSDHTDSKAKVCLGAIASPHGVRGLLRVKAFTDLPEDIAAYGDVYLEDGRGFAIEVKGMVKGMVLAGFSGVTTREAADALKGERFYVDRASLPEPEEGSLYHADLIGKVVHDPTRGLIGQIRGVFDFGAGEMLDVKPPQGKAVMVPFGQDAVMDDQGLLIMAVDAVWLDDDTEKETNRKKGE
jgi:16S rRNA processing protein RimM